MKKYDVLRSGIVEFTGTYKECVEYAKDNGLMIYSPMYGWHLITDAGIV